MGLDRPIDVTAEQREILLALLGRHLPGAAAWVYGSRVKWTARPASDLDMVVFAASGQERRVSDLRDAFEESNLPFRVDLFVWDEIPERFRERIQAEYVVLVEKEELDLVDKWERRKIGTLGRVVTGKTPATAERSNFDGPYPFITIPDLNRRVLIDKTERTLSDKGAAVLEKCLLPPGAVLMSCIATVGKCGITTRPSFTNQQINSVIPKEEIDSRFLYYVFTQLGQELESTGGGGSVYTNVSKSRFSDIEVLIPIDLTEQRAIAHVLGVLDDKIELNRRMNETLEATARALFKSWFVDFDPVRAKMEGRDTGLPRRIADLFPDRLVDSELGEIPEGWQYGTIHDIASLNPESWSATNRPEKLVYVDLANTKWGYIESVRTFLWDKAPSRARRVLRKGDTIIATVRPGNGSFALIDQDGLTGSTGFTVLRPYETADRELVWCAGTSSENIDRLSYLADGGAYPAIRPDAVGATPVVLVTPATREAFSRLVCPLLDKIEANKRESRVLAVLRDTLLPKLMSGELRVLNTSQDISLQT